VESLVLVSAKRFINFARYFAPEIAVRFTAKLLVPTDGGPAVVALGLVLFDRQGQETDRSGSTL
jgi:hypothetical protein